MSEPMEISLKKKDRVANFFAWLDANPKRKAVANELSEPAMQALLDGLMEIPELRPALLYHWDLKNGGRYRKQTTHYLVMGAMWLGQEYLTEVAHQEMREERKARGTK